MLVYLCHLPKVSRNLPNASGITHICVCEEALSRIKVNKSSLYPTILQGKLTGISKCAQIFIQLHSNKFTKFYNNKERSRTYYNVQFDVGFSKVN
jgi:hypothetical protein